MDFFRKLSANALFFLGFCTAKPRCFLGGNRLQGAARAALFCLTGIAGFYLVQWECTQFNKLSFLFVGLNGRLGQFEAT